MFSLFDKGRTSKRGTNIFSILFHLHKLLRLHSRTSRHWWNQILLSSLLGFPTHEIYLITLQNFLHLHISCFRYLTNSTTLINCSKDVLLTNLKMTDGNVLSKGTYSIWKMTNLQTQGISGEKRLKEPKEANGFTSTWKSLVYLRIKINFTISSLFLSLISNRWTPSKITSFLKNIAKTI